MTPLSFTYYYLFLVVNLANRVQKWGYNSSLQNIFETDEDYHLEKDRDTYFELLTEYRKYKMNYASNIKFDSGVNNLSRFLVLK